MKTKNLILTLFVILLAVSLSACDLLNTEAENSATEMVDYAVPETSAVIAEGTLLPIQAEYIAFQAYGFVEEIYVELGDQVTAGQQLARLSSADQVEAQLTAAELELLSAQQAVDALIRSGDANLAAAWTALLNVQAARAEAQRAWDELDLDDIEDRIDDAEVEVLDREEDLEDAQEEFDKYADLDEDNSFRMDAEDDLEEAQADYNAAVRELEEITRERDAVQASLDAAIAAEVEAQYQFEISADGPNADDLALAQACLENAQAQLTAVQDLMNNYVLVAPFDGVVAGLNVDVGEQVAAGTWAVSIANTSAWIVESTDVTELEIVRIFVGQSVSFTPDAFQEVSISGVVTEIGLSPVVQSGDVTYLVRVAVDQADIDPRVMWGMTVELVFEPVD